MIEIVTGGLEQECFEPFYYNIIYRNYGERRLERIEMEGAGDMCDVAQNLETEVDSSAVENDNSSEETEAATTEEQN